MTSGKIFIFPTESSYAIGCRYNDTVSIKKIMQLKGRTDDRFTVVAASLEQVKKHFKFTSQMEQLALKYWPGALSIVVSKKFAVRVMAVPMDLPVPLIATSLNVSGQPPVFDLKNHLVKTRLIASLPDDFLPDDSIIDVGPLPQRPPSTVVECFRGGYVIHRQGAVKLI
ncbi:MAG: Sua5/YciO/YrdC/YwlC family protein [Patescibacteria group bacterium]